MRGEPAAVAPRLVGIGPALIDCDRDNPASRRVIDKSGGRFDREEGLSPYFQAPTGRRR